MCSCRLNMEIPLSQYGTVSFDEIRSRCKFPLDKRSILSRRSFSFNRRKWGLVKCSSSVEEALRPRPMPKRKVELRIEEEEVAMQPRRTNPWVCGQIEKLVLQKRYREALEFFEDLELDGNVEIGGSTYDALISACIGSKSVGGVKRVHNYMIKIGFEQDLYIRNRVLLMHVKCSMMLDARKLFDEMPEKNLVSWNTIIGALIDAGDLMEAFHLFFAMLDDLVEVESWILATMLRASAQLGSLSAGRQLHSFASKLGVVKDTFISCTLVNMYSKCGSIEEAQYVFAEMPEKTTVGWNTLIAGYALHGLSEEALSIYSEMRDSGVKRDPFTFSVVVSICARLGSLDHAKQAHTDMIRQGFGQDLVANTALVDFYSKWGRIEDARHVFDYMLKKNLQSWNALINGYRHQGKGEEAVQLFEDMIQQGMRPNQVTFLGVLLACSNSGSGLLDRGWEIFESMERDHKIKPRSMHYTCMIELLGREGLLDEALNLIIDSRCETVNMWAALLTACRVHEKFELGKFAAEKVYGMEPEKLNNYIVLLNIYNRAGKDKEAAEVVNALRKKGLRMVRANTLIEINKTSQVFLSGDKSHPQTKDIYQKVDELMLEISKHGYVPQEKHFLPDVDENEVKVRFYHSEKLAIAFGLINSQDWSPLHLIQSHRVCNDCHSAIKMISVVTGREIVMRDSSRFHHFKDGRCSCGDYW